MSRCWWLDGSSRSRQRQPDTLADRCRNEEVDRIVRGCQEWLCVGEQVTNHLRPVCASRALCHPRNALDPGVHVVADVQTHLIANSAIEPEDLDRVSPTFGFVDGAPLHAVNRLRRIQRYPDDMLERIVGTRIHEQRMLPVHLEGRVCLGEGAAPRNHERSCPRLQWEPVALPVGAIACDAGEQQVAVAPSQPPVSSTIDLLLSPPRIATPGDGLGTEVLDWLPFKSGEPFTVRALPLLLLVEELLHVVVAIEDDVPPGGSSGDGLLQSSAQRAPQLGRRGAAIDPDHGCPFRFGTGANLGSMPSFRSSFFSWTSCLSSFAVRYGFAAR